MKIPSITYNDDTITFRPSMFDLSFFVDIVFGLKTFWNSSYFFSIKNA